MAPNIQTQHDPELREPKNDQLNGFDPLAVFGFSINDPIPDEATLRARYHKLVRLIGVIYRGDSRIPYTLADVNRARENLLNSYRRTVEVTREYHKPTWNPAADERDLAALLTPAAAAAQPAAAPTSSQSHHNPVRETRAVSSSPAYAQPNPAFATDSSSSRPRTPSVRSHHRGDTKHSSSDDDFCIVSSRSSVSTRKDPISEFTKQEMRKWAEKQDESHMRSKGAPNKGASKAKEPAQEALKAADNRSGNSDDEVVYLGTGNEIPGYLLVGHDRRAGGGGRLMVMCVDCRNHANFYALTPTGRRIGGFRLERASYDDVNQSPAMLTVLRNIGEIAPAHVQASREEMKAYYEVMIAQREAGARKP